MVIWLYAQNHVDYFWQISPVVSIPLPVGRCLELLLQRGPVLRGQRHPRSLHVVYPVQAQTKQGVQVEGNVILFHNQNLKPGCFQARVELAPPPPYLELDESLGVGVLFLAVETRNLKGMYFQLVETLKPSAFQPRVNLMCSTCTASPRTSASATGL